MSSHTPVRSQRERTLEPLLTIDAAAAFLSISRRQVYTLLERRELPHVRVGERTRFIPADLRASSGATVRGRGHERERPPGQAAPITVNRAPKRTDWSGWRLRREVNRLPDDELSAVVRGMVSVDRAVQTFRRKDAETVFIPPSRTA
jgi:excisionase family DNA binding protein